MTHGRLQPLILSVLILAAPLACAQDKLPIQIERQSVIRPITSQTAAAVTHELILSVINIDSWPEAEITAAVHQSAQILAQCGIRTANVDLLRVTVPDTHRYFDTPRSRELARTLALPKPSLYFTAGTRQMPAFDAEAIGRGNSRTRPELTDTVWIARGARDLGIVIAHELAHVLMDNGEHDNTAGNLMAEATTPQNTQLTAAQCTRIRTTGERNGLLQSGVN